MNEKSIWDQLGIDPTRDQQTIRQAYALKLKQTNPEDDPVAFQALRSAYEAAIRWLDIPVGKPAVFPKRARLRAKTEVKSAVDDASRVATSAEHQTSEHENRAMAFIAELRQTLTARNSVTPSQLERLDEVLRDVVQGPMALRVEFESDLADLILAHVPDTDNVTARAAQQLDWASYHAMTGTRNRLRGAVAHSQGLILLDQLRAGTHKLSAAYRVLAEPPTRWRFRARALLTDLPARVRELLALLRGEYPTIEAYLDKGTVAWWGNYHARARVKFGWVLLAPPLGLACGYVLAAQSRFLDDLIHPLLRFIFVGILATVTIWQAIRFTAEWAPILMTQVRSRFARSMIHLGWFPVSLFLVLAIGACQGQSLVRGLLVLSAVGCVAWAAAMRGAEQQPSDWATHLVSLVIVSFPVVGWLVLLGDLIPTDLLIALLCAIVAQLLGFGSLFQRCWLAIPSAARRPSLAALMLCAAATLVYLFASSGHRDLNQLTASVVVAVVLVLRVPAVTLPGMPFLALVAVMAAAIGPLAFAFSHLEGKQLELTGGGIWLVGGAALAVAMLFALEKRQ